MNLIGTVAEIDPKEGKNGQMWLLKFKLVALDGSAQWMGAYIDRKDSPKAFIQRAIAEDGLPQEQRTVWEVEAEEKEERGYTNLYVTSAKSSTNGHAPTAAAADTPVFAATSRIGPSERDTLIVRQVALKEASAITQVLMAANPKMSGDDILASVRDLTNEFTAVVLSPTPAPEEEPVKAKEDSLFGEEPL